METSLLSVIFEKSFIAGVAVYLLVRMWQVQKEAAIREKRLGERLDHVEDVYRDKLSKISEDSVQAIKENYRSLRRLTTASGDLVMALRARPCLTEDSYEPHHSIYAEHSLPRTPRPTGDTTKEETKTDYHKRDAS